MSGLASKLLYKAVQCGQSASKYLAWMRETPLAGLGEFGVPNNFVSLARIFVVATNIGGPVAGAVSGVVHVVGDFYGTAESRNKYVAKCYFKLPD